MSFFRIKKIGKYEYLYYVDKSGDRTVERSLGQCNKVLQRLLLNKEDDFTPLERLKRAFQEEEVRNKEFESLVLKDTVMDAKPFGALWLASLMEKEVGLKTLVDKSIRQHSTKRLPTTGMFFLIGSLNRLIHPVSKERTGDWLASLAFLPLLGDINTSLINSDTFWQHWNRVSEEQLYAISDAFLAKCYSCATHGIQPADKSAFMFDTTNYYTFMASGTPSEIARRGKNKQGRDNLRQIGLSLLVDKDTGIPLHGRVYPGNRHDSKQFSEIAREMLSHARKLGCGEITLVYDKGINSPENAATIDEMDGVHFLTGYSCHNRRELMDIPLKDYSIVECTHNARIKETALSIVETKGGSATSLLDQRIRAFRTTGEYWGRERTVVVYYNPPTAANQAHTFDSNLARLRTWLREAQKKVRAKLSGWTKPEEIRKAYAAEAKRCHIPPLCFELTLENRTEGLFLGFSKRNVFINDSRKLFGKTLLITDRMEVKTGEIVQLYLDRYEVEKAFRQTKDSSCCSVWPIRHWTDQKIRCHVFCSLVALAYMRMIELRLRQGGVHMTGSVALELMSQVQLGLVTVPLGEGKSISLQRMIGMGSSQTQIVEALGYKVTDGGICKVKSNT